MKRKKAAEAESIEDFLIRDNSKEKPEAASKEQNQIATAWKKYLEERGLLSNSRFGVTFSKPYIIEEKEAGGIIDELCSVMSTGVTGGSGSSEYSLQYRIIDREKADKDDLVSYDDLVSGKAAENIKKVKEDAKK